MYKIKLEKNKIDNLEKLKCLDGHKIKKLNLEGNPIVESNKEYKKDLFELIPTLMAIDGTDKNGGTVESTLYGDEEDEEEEDDDYGTPKGEDDDDGEYLSDDGGEDDYGHDEDDEDEDEEDEEDENPKKKRKE